MTTVTHLSVIVPAADEQDTIEACLASIRRARTMLRAQRPDVGVDVVVVLDDCHDDTARIVAGFPDVRAVLGAARSVGVARRVGSAAAEAWAPLPASRLWLANTDADCVVPEHWLLDHLRHAGAGAALLLGTVLPDLAEPALSRWRAQHEHGDGHPHIHGANLGVRADVLHEIGGWPAMRSDEDVELVHRALARGLPVARGGSCAVTTSARCVGRAPRGFSGYLAELIAGPRVGPASDAEVTHR